MLRYLQIVACALCLAICPSSRPTIPPRPAELPRYIDYSIAQSRSVRQKAILRGMRWLHKFIQDDDNLVFVFDDYVLMMNELTLERPGSPVAVAAEHILRNCFKRASSKLNRIFKNDEEGKWRFLSIMPLLEKWSIDKERYIAFYRHCYQGRFNYDYSADFEEAMENNDYDMLGTILIDTSFPYYYNQTYGGDELDIPKTGFKTYLDRVVDLEYIYSVDDPDAYSDQNYFVTHIFFVAINYGENRTADLSRYKNAINYLDEHFDTVRTEVNDLDLLAEFVHCLRLCGRGSTDRVQTAIDEILSKQHPDGSWGTKEDFAGDPYDIFHPTWAVVTALNY